MSIGSWKNNLKKKTKILHCIYLWRDSHLKYWKIKNEKFRVSIILVVHLMDADKSTERSAVSAESIIRENMTLYEKPANKVRLEQVNVLR